MAGRGRQFSFHGAFKSKAKAIRKERSRQGAFIKTVHIKGQRRYVVMSKRTP